MNRFTKAFATSATVASFLLANLAGATPAAAAGTGQIEGGPAVYEAKNLTTGSAYGDNTTVAACQELQYSIRLHNSGFVAVNNINVKVTLPSTAGTTNISTVTATYTDGLTPSTSDTTTVISATPQTITYEAGTTQLFDGTGTLVGSQADGIVSGGLSLGSLNGSTTEYVNFKAKTNCPTPETPAYSCTLLHITPATGRKVTIDTFTTAQSGGATFKNVDINWGDNGTQNFTNAVGQMHTFAADGTYTIVATPHFDVNGQDKTANSPTCQQVVSFKSSQPTPPQTPTTLVNTGAGNVAGLFAGASILGAYFYRRNLSRKLSREV